MLKNFSKITIFLIGILLLFGCATTKAPPSAFTPHRFQVNQYMKKIDNFIIIQDASSSMGEKYAGSKKLTLAKDILDRMNQTIPEFDYTCGLRTFGEGFWAFRNGTSLIYGLKRYSKAELGEAIKPIKYAGITPMGLGIDGAVEDLKATRGKIAVIILSDGMETDNNALASAENMKKIYGDRLCIYTILIGNNALGKKLMERIARIGKCGFAVNADQIYPSEDMADFVEKVFLTKAKIKAQPLPPPPSAPPPTPAKALPPPPVKKVVPKVIDRMTLLVNYDFDKAIISEGDRAKLQKAIDFIIKYPNSQIVIEGHTCSIGTESYNQGLSERRAHAVKKFLVKKGGISESRIKTVGHGELKPFVSNKTRQGRVKNRRAEILILSE